MSFCNIEKSQIIMKEIKKIELNLTVEEMFAIKMAVQDGLDQIDKTQREYDRL